MLMSSEWGVNFPKSRTLVVLCWRRTLVDTVRTNLPTKDKAKVLYRKSPPKEDNLSTKDKKAGPERVGPY